MQNCFMAQAAQTGVAMHDIDLLPDDYIPEYRKEREDCRECRFTVDDEERNIVDFEAIGEVSDAGSVGVGVCYYYDFVAAVNELRGQLVDVRLDTPGLRVEEVARHRNVVGHFGRELTAAACLRVLGIYCSCCSEVS